MANGFQIVKFIGFCVQPRIFFSNLSYLHLSVVMGIFGPQPNRHLSTMKYVTENGNGSPPRRQYNNSIRIESLREVRKTSQYVEATSWSRIARNRPFLEENQTLSIKKTDIWLVYWGPVLHLEILGNIYILESHVHGKSEKISRRTCKSTTKPRNIYFKPLSLAILFFSFVITVFWTLCIFSVLKRQNGNW